MDQAVLDQIQQQAGAHPPRELCLYLPEADVPDPWGKTPDDFAACAALIAAAPTVTYRNANSRATTTPAGKLPRPAFDTLPARSSERPHTCPSTPPAACQRSA